ncbi:hypothetical protein BKA70DRAFT_281636 [Coprinopsis sp. MPI-PUGE-AT-0042]|nr:hypothetical protein BKA70DRAFT_281636 [Coprinopsis sp. MPI-PUGE-AT-0042]
MAAAHCGPGGIVKLILEHPEIQINLVNRSEVSALILSAQSGHQAVVKLLLAHPQIQINRLDIGKRSALMLATRCGQESVVKLLLAHPEIGSTKPTPCSRRPSYWPLIMATNRSSNSSLHIPRY